MGLQELAAQLACLYGVEAQPAQLDFEALGGTGPALCAMEPGFPPAIAGRPVSPRWIATDQPPVQVQAWPRDVAPPYGWHEVPSAEARRLQLNPFIAPSSLAVIAPLDASRVAALSTAEPSADVAARRPPRTPRAARYARLSRLPRLSREPRLTRQARAPRPPRKARVPRPPRLKREPRPKRPPFKKTSYDVGMCKRPSCNCWTPAGCASRDLWVLMGSPKGSTGFGPCFPGPCYDYVACVTHQCGSDVACAVQTIFEFWARQYKAVSVHVDPFVAPLIAVAPLVARAALAALPAIQSITILKGLLDQPAYTAGCAPGEAWHWSLTGLRCMTTPNLARLATAEEVQAFIAATTGRSLD